MDNNSSFEERLEKASPTKKAEFTSSDSTSHKENIGKYARFMHVGSEIVGGVIAGFFLGFTLDYFLNTKPLFTAIFAILGIFIGLYNAYRHLMKITDANNSKSQKKD